MALRHDALRQVPHHEDPAAAIYKNVNKALSGTVTPEEALTKAQTDMEKALKTF